MLRSIAFTVLIVIAFAAFGYSCSRLVRTLSLGKPENRLRNVPPRLKNVLTIVFGQSKLLREPFAGMMHFFIFWGFVILLTAVFEAVVEGFAPGFTLKTLGPLFPPVAALQEFIGAMVILSCVIALARWYLSPPKRYFGREITGHVRLDATLILALILTIMLSMFGVNATRMILSGQPVPSRFVSRQIASVFSGSADAPLLYQFFWWTHIAVIFGFLNYLPYSKHLHILSSVPNVFCASLRPRGELKKLDFEAESAGKFGAEDSQDLTWKQLLDGFTCTDCGRCTAACPASITGKPLSPRKIIMNIRERTSELAPRLLAGKPLEGGNVAERKLVDGFISEQELWDCTTCRACMQECPVMIEHVPSIMEMRRYLVLSESRFPSELTSAFKSLETNFNPWGFAPESRADWAKGLDIKTMAEVNGKADFLYWVGCAGSYDQRYQKVARATARLLKSADVNFAILGNEEKCNGDPARRAGNEYLSQMLIADNVETLHRYGVKRIIATCPHCFNTLRNEYPRFGTSFDVQHHTEFIERLIRARRLRLNPLPSKTTVFHDSCYIGRYHEIYDAPRNVVRNAGAAVKEMKRSRSRGLCCGAGGARMWMEEKIGKRINVERTEEALSLNPEWIATECPFCMTMLSDGLKAKDAEERVAVRDVAEILADALIEKE